MVNYFVAAFFMGVAIGAGNPVFAATPADSVGVEIKNGVRLIRHQVAPKENIYSVGRKYGVSVSKISQANPGLKTLIIGQVIYIPAPAAAKAVAAAAKPTGPALFDEEGNRVHKVDSRQTLFSIARMYGISTSDLKKWNKLPDDNVYNNQTLIVKPATSAVIAQVKPVKPESTAIIAATPMVIARPEVVRPDNTVVRRDDTVKTVAPRETFSRVTESGLAELISEGILSNKYLALHKTAPIGSFLTVRNQMNNQTVSVRVIGKLPDIGANEKVVVKVSKRAFQRLGAIDNRFLVEVQYEVVDKALSASH